MSSECKRAPAVIAQRDALQYIRDETLNLANAHEPLDNIVATVTLPSSLAIRPALWSSPAMVPLPCALPFFDFVYAEPARKLQG